MLHSVRRPAGTTAAQSWVEGTAEMAESIPQGWFLDKLSSDRTESRAVHVAGPGIGRNDVCSHHTPAWLRCQGVVALKETIRLKGEIDEIIPSWPIE